VLRNLAELHFAPRSSADQQDHSLSRVAPYQASRKHLEHAVRSRLRALPSVEILPECEVVGLVASADQERVTVKYVSRPLRLAEGALGRTRLVLIGATSDRPTVLALSAHEGGGEPRRVESGR
jgi:2-polyprenyl-6-methoxyphenol hydroxylase-like FAD-dependent oxidoreductase